MALNIVQEEDFGSGEAVLKQVFQPYVCRSIRDRGLPHAGDIAEASSLSAIPLPPSDYPLWDSLPTAIVDQGKLSQLQLEGVLYACSRHQQILPSGERAGFFIGDGAGVGKGRQIAGVILDNYVRGRRRHLWLSTSSDLHVDAMRDLRDLGAYIPLINGCTMLDKGTRALGLDKDLQEGVLFLTYSTLISAGRAGKSRLEQVLEWLAGGPSAATGTGAAATAAIAAAAQAWDGVFVLDECHKAKNFTPGKEAQSTKVASAVIELQTLLPNARVLYCSATGVSEVANMAYMSRMGLWGPSSPFPDFAAFLESMKKRGVSFMELLAMEMKAAGRYVARGLSFRQAEFLQVEAPLSPDRVQQYDAAVALWQTLRVKLELALQLAGNDRRDLWKMFWATQQRFFKLLCIGLKLDTVIAEAKAALASGMCVVIGLQSTGEAAADAMGLEPGPLPGFVSPCKEMLMRFIQQNFPLHHQQSPEALAAGLPPEAIPACRQMKQQLLDQVATLDLPPNFLDQLIDQLGGPAVVAEMTGRKGRVVREQRRGGGSSNAGAAGRVVYELRAKPDSSEMDSLNVTEREAFLAGKKRVAMISDAASTGISLHAAQTAANKHQRRLHLTIELPWSADKAIQQLGRSHRTNQVSAPLYKLVVSAAGGERRFAAAVARRLQSLGALTRGDRRAAAGVDLSDSNFDTPWGRKSLRKMYDHIVTESPQLPSGVTVSSLLKDLFVTPNADSAEAQSTGAEESAAAAQKEHQQQHQDETMHLLQQQLPALSALQRLAAAEAAAAAKAAAAAAKTAAAANGTAGASPMKVAAAAAAKEAAEEAMIVAALTGKAPPPSAAAAFMTATQVGAAISELHRELRSCCDMMGIGLTGRNNDTVVEERIKDTVAKDAKEANAAAPAAKDLGDVRRFLNRLLGLPLGKQNLLFNYFAATLAAEIAAAKSEGRYTEGVSDIHGSSVQLARPPELLWGETNAGEEAGAAAHTWVNTLQVDRGVTFEDAVRRLSHESFPGCASSFRRSRRPMFGTHLVLLALQKPGLKNMFSLVRPNTGESFYDMDRAELDEKYAKASAEAVEPEWRAQHESSLTSCIHGPACASRQTCQVGRRLTEVTILSGSVVRVWGVLETILERRAAELSKADRTMRVVRVTLHEQQRKQQQQQQSPSKQQQQQGGSEQSQSPVRRQQQQPPSQEQQQLEASAVQELTDQQQEADQASSRGLTAAAATERTIVGVRYPASLLSEVVATLASLQHNSSSSTFGGGLYQQTMQPAWGQTQQQAMQQQQGLVMSGWWASGVQKQQQQQQASSKANAQKRDSLTEVLGIARIEPATPVDKRLQAKAFRAPKTLRNYFQAPGQVVTAAAAVDAGAQRCSSDGDVIVAGATETAAATAAGGAVRSASAPAAAAAGKAVGSCGCNGNAMRGGAEASTAAAAAGATAPGKKGAVVQSLRHGGDSFFKRSAQAAATAGPSKKPDQQQLPPAKKPRLVAQQQQQQQQLQSAKAESSSVVIVDSDTECDVAETGAETPPAAAAVDSAAAIAAGNAADGSAADGGSIERKPDRSSGPSVAATKPYISSKQSASKRLKTTHARGLDDCSISSDDCMDSSKQGEDEESVQIAAAAAASSRPKRSAAAAAASRRGNERAVDSESDIDANDISQQVVEHDNDSDYNPETVVDVQKLQQERQSTKPKPQQQQLHKQTSQLQRHSRQKPTGVGATAKAVTTGRSKRSAAAAGSAGGAKQQKQQRFSKQTQHEKLQLLAGMGFTGMKAERALWVCQGDVDRAIEWCLTSA